MKLVDAIVNNAPKLLEAALTLIVTLAKGLITNIPQLIKAIPQIVKSIVNGFKSLMSSIIGIGKNIVNGIWQGIQSMVSWFTSKVKGFFSGIVNGVKNALGIHSPSKVFASIGGYMAEGLGEGWAKEYKNIEQGIVDDLNFDAGTVDFAASSSGQLSKKLQQLIYMNTDQNIGLNVFLDGKVISKSVTKYQRNAERAYT